MLRLEAVDALGVDLADDAHLRVVEERLDDRWHIDAAPRVIAEQIAEQIADVLEVDHRVEHGGGFEHPAQPCLPLPQPAHARDQTRARRRIDGPATSGTTEPGLH